MAVIPDIEQIKATVARMEMQYSTSRNGQNHVLWPAYLQAVARFEGDLADERDIWLSKAAALMVLKFEQLQSTQD